MVGKTAEMATLWATVLPFVRFSVVWASHRKVWRAILVLISHIAIVEEVQDRFQTGSFMV